MSLIEVNVSTRLLMPFRIRSAALEQRGGAAVAGLDQLDLAALEGVVHLLAFFGQLDHEFVELGEAAFEFLDLHHQLGQELVAFLRRLADVQVIDHALVEQFQLRIEFGHAFDRQQLFRLPLQGRPGAVHLGEDYGDAIDDRGPLGRVVDLQVADDFDQHFQLAGGGRHVRLDLLGVADPLERADLGGVFADPLFVRLQGGGLQQELHAAMGQPVRLLGDFLFQSVDQRQVGVPQVPQGDHVAARAAQVGQRADEIVDVLEPLPVQRPQDLLELLVNPLDFGGGVLFDPDDFLEFVDRGGGRAADFAQHLAQVEAIRAVDPEITVVDVTGQLGEVDVQVGVGIFLGDQVEHFVAFRHAPDQVAVADLVQERIGFGRGDVVLAHVRRLPDLQGMVLLRLGLGFEADQFAAVKERRTVTQDRGFDRLFDQVVPQQHVVAGVAVVEHVQEIFAVGGGQPPLEDHPGQTALEDLGLAALQVVAVGENDPVVVGQQHAGVGDRIQPHGPLDLFAVDDVAEPVFLIRTDLQQDQIADRRVVDLGIVQRLVLVLDRLGVDSGSRVRIVFDLDRQVAAHRLDKNAILDRDVRVHAGTMLVASRADPFELVLGRKAEFVFAAVVLIHEPLALQRPLERLHVRRALADAEDHEQVRAEDGELGERGVPVVPIDLFEVPLEPRVGDRIQPLAVKGAVAKLVDREHVRQGGFGLQAQVDVVAEEEAVADRHHVARHAVVVGRNPLGAQQSGLDRAEHLAAGVVQLSQARTEILGLVVQAAADDLVGAAFDLNSRSGLGSLHAERSSISRHWTAATFLFDRPRFLTMSNKRASSLRVSSLSVMPIIFSSRAATVRSLTSPALRSNWAISCSSFCLKYSGLPLKNVFLTSVSVSLLWTKRSTALPPLTASTILSKNVVSPPTMSMRALLRASLTIRDWASAISC